MGSRLTESRTQSQDRPLYQSNGNGGNPRFTSRRNEMAARHNDSGFTGPPYPPNSHDNALQPPSTAKWRVPPGLNTSVLAQQPSAGMAQFNTSSVGSQSSTHQTYVDHQGQNGSIGSSGLPISQSALGPHGISGQNFPTLADSHSFPRNQTMSTNTVPQIGEGNPLEDRLRDLILKNNDAIQQIGPGPTPQGERRNFAPGSLQGLPPHMMTASPNSQQAYLADHRNMRRDVMQSATSQNGTGPVSPTRRRPNQAQRRERQAELMAAIEPQTPPSRCNNSVRDFPRHPHPQSPQNYSKMSAEMCQPQHNHPGRFQHLNHQNYARGNSASSPNIRGPQSPYRQLFTQHSVEIEYLDRLAQEEVEKAAIHPDELADKEVLRSSLEKLCREAIVQHERLSNTLKTFDPDTVALRGFGSVASGFATTASDMDLALLSPTSTPDPGAIDSQIPRVIEKILLENGYGARLLTKTRVPIIKLCEKPTPELQEALLKERAKWEEEKDHPSVDEEAVVEAALEEDVLAHDDEAGTAANNPVESNKSPEDPFHDVCQRSRDTLFAYYRRTKKSLETAGGRDYMMIQHRPLTLSEGELLNSFCKAFVNGLQDQELKRRLFSYRSLSFGNGYRSLSGVFTQVEGETIVMSWEKRKISEITTTKDQEGEEAVQAWRNLQDADAWDILGYNNNLKVVLEKLKVLSSAKLGLLEERHEEDPQSYSSRALAIWRELSGTPQTALAPGISSSERERKVIVAVIDQFITGVNDDYIKEYLLKFFGDKQNVLLEEVIAQYQAERKLFAFNKALQKGRYTETETKTIKAFADIVRRSGAVSESREFQNIKAALEKLSDPSPLRERPAHLLDFPKSGVGIQCDINFSNHLALYNTQLLRCYSLCDPRVRKCILFVKVWAKRRLINSPYHGTLSSYGWVLMVLHYLMNVASPPVIPNLQLGWRPPGYTDNHPIAEVNVVLEGYEVHFWRDEENIKKYAESGKLTYNQDSVGALLRGFFEYYSHQGPRVVAHGFSWGLDTLSLRTPGGLLSKQVKGWTGAKTEIIDAKKPGDVKKEVRHRYLFAIEDPFELDHNVARTVTHNGIVAIRDELRRAWRILGSVSRGQGPKSPEEELLAALRLPSPQQAPETPVDGSLEKVQSDHKQTAMN